MTQRFALVPVNDIGALTETVQELCATVADLRQGHRTWMGISEAAKFLGCSASTIRRRASRGELQVRGNGRGRKVLVERSR